MRPRIVWVLPGLVVAFALGVIAADREWVARGLALAAAGWCAAIAPLVARSPTGTSACALGLTLALGVVRFEAGLGDGARAPLAGSADVALEARVCEVRRAPTWVRARLCDAVAIPFGGVAEVGTVPSRISWTESRTEPSGEWLAARRPGDWIRGRFRVGPLAGRRNPGGRTWTTSQRRRGVSHRGRLLDARLATTGSSGVEGSPARGLSSLRPTLAGRLAAHGPGGGLFAALALGERSALGAADRDAFRRLGISHLLAVSGLHLVLLAGLVYVVLCRTGGRVPPWVERADVRVGASLGAVAAAFGYALLAGWGVPVRRALVFGLMVAAAVVSGRPRATGHALAGAGLAVAFAEPAAVFELGPQLSFCATAALLLDRGVRGGLVGGLRVSATAVAATAPILAAHGVGSSALGLVANTAAVPWTAFVLLPSALAATALAWLTPEADSLIGGLAVSGEVTLAVVAEASQGLPDLRRTEVGTSVILVAALLALATLAARSTSVRLLLAAAVCGVLAFAPARRVEPAAPRLVALDVGLGDALLVQGGRATMLVDGGWAGTAAADADLGRSVVLPALAALGVDRLDVIVATHADVDHRGGLPAVIDALPVGEVWVPASAAPKDFAELRAAASREGVPVVARWRSERPIHVGDLRAEVLWPPAPREAHAARSRNDGSLVVGVDVAGTRVLLMGDVGAAVEAALLADPDRVRADVLKVAHHGSRGSSTDAFLRAVAPELALLSAPCSPHARLPTREVLRRLEGVGAEVGWTGRDGALLVGLAGGGRSLRRWQPDATCQPP